MLSLMAPFAMLPGMGLIENEQVLERIRCHRCRLRAAGDFVQTPGFAGLIPDSAIGAAGVWWP